MNADDRNAVVAQGTVSPCTVDNRPALLDLYRAPYPNSSAVEAAADIRCNRRGRKPASQSRAPEFRNRLAGWKQMHESSRPSLRAVARELGTSHQLLSHYLRYWSQWERKEC